MNISNFLKKMQIVLLIVIIGVFIVISISITNERKIVALQAEYKQLGLDLQAASDYLTNQSVAYVVSGDQENYHNYYHEVEVARTREKVVNQLIRLGAPKNELELLEKAKSLSEELSLLEISAFDKVQLNHMDEAREDIFGHQYKIMKNAINDTLQKFQEVMNERCEKEVKHAQKLSKMAFATVIIITIIVFLIVEYAFILLKKKVQSIANISNIAWKISQGDFIVNLDEYKTNDEFGMLANSFSNMIETIHNIKMQINKIIDASHEGNFNQRADISNFHGDWADILYRLNDMLQIVIDEEKKVGDLKTQFLVNMSHEIRTPMNAVIGLSQLALRKEQTKENRDIYNKINISAKNLLRIINDILDFSKIQADKMEIVETQFSLEEILENAFMMTSESIGAKKVEILLNMAHNVPDILYGDKTRLWQILKNLLDNSAKYTNIGKVVLNVFIKEVISRDDNIEVINLIFKIEDSGIGMTKEQLEKLFVPFEQFHHNSLSINNKNQGTGLGMSITKRLVELMKGTITVDSLKDVGTTVEIVIPFKVEIGVKTLKEKVNSYSLPHSKILIADDNIYACDVMTNLLGLLGIKPTCVNTGNDAVKTIIEHEKAGESFDLIILDYVLGETNGVEVAKKIKDITQTAKLCMVSAYTKGLLADTISGVGFDSIIEKPFIPSQFIKIISETLYQQSQPSSEENTEVYFKNAKVLICEDNEYNQNVAIGILKLFGIDPIIANDGQEAINILEKQEIHLVFMDIMMPVRDGYETTKIIRSNSSTYQNVPIVAMTANVMKSAVERCLEVGMNGHIGKPLEIEIVMAQLIEYLSLYIHEREPAMEINHNLDTIHVSNKETIVIPGVEVEKGIARYAGEVDKYLKSLKNFIEDLPEEFISYETFISEEHYKQSVIEVHTLKGASANLSIIKLYEACQDLEDNLNQETMTQDIYQHWINTIQECKEEILPRL